MSPYKLIDFHIRGVCPLIVHNGQLSDPTSEASKKIKELAGRGKKKTDDIHEQISRLEFLFGLYIGPDGEIGIKPDMIEAMLVEGGKRRRKGREFKSGLVCDRFYPLIYKGPTDPEKLYERKEFVDRRRTRVQQNAIMRTRPIFHQWELKFSVAFLPAVLNESDVRDTLVECGIMVGLGDYRPRFGRFDVVN